MNKIFEDYFSELQADMVSICLEYAENRADKIYIYCSCEKKVISSNFFYIINGILLKKHKLNDAIKLSDNGFSYDISIERQNAALEIINEDIEEINEVCQKYNREMPTEMKLIYDVNKNSLEAKYRYDLVYSNDSEKTARDVADEWFEQIKSENTV